LGNPQLGKTCAAESPAAIRCGRDPSANSDHVKAREQYQFHELPRLHAEIEAGQLAEARRRLERLQRVRWEKELQYAVDLAECRLTLAEPPDYDDYENEIGPGQLRDLIQREPSRSRLISTWRNRTSKPSSTPKPSSGRGLPDRRRRRCDVLAIRGEAAYAMVLNDTARADFDKGSRSIPRMPAR